MLAFVIWSYIILLRLHLHRYPAPDQTLPRSTDILYILLALLGRTMFLLYNTTQSFDWLLAFGFEANDGLGDFQRSYQRSIHQSFCVGRKECTRQQCVFCRPHRRGGRLRTWPHHRGAVGVLFRVRLTDFALPVGEIQCHADFCADVATDGQRDLFRVLNRAQIEAPPSSSMKGIWWQGKSFDGSPNTWSWLD